MFQRSTKEVGQQRSTLDQSDQQELAVPINRSVAPQSNIHGLSDTLFRAFEVDNDRDNETVPKQPDKAASNAVKIRRAIKIGIAAGLAFALGWKPMLATLTTSSAEAFVNTRVVTLRAPFGGTVEGFSPATRLGASIAGGDELMRISEPLADRARVMDVERSLSRARVEQHVLDKRVQFLGAQKAELDRQVDAFRINRVGLLKERIGVVEEKIHAAIAVQQEASISVARNSKLDAAGLARDGSLARAVRDQTVAGRSIDELKHQVAAMRVELDALNANQFVGDSFNDRPQSAQRSEQLSQLIGELSIDLNAKGEEIANLTSQLAAEKERVARLSTVQISVPTAGLVWELLTSPGERVARDQELIRVIDCSQTIVSAAVEEDVYNRIHLGEDVSFRLRGEGTDRAGKVVQLSGLAATPANLAISPSTLLKAPYRVAISVPSLGDDGVCGIGRTGKVTFETPNFFASAVLSAK